MDTNLILLSLQLVLPAFNNFAQKADLGIPLPLEQKQVTKTNTAKYGSSVMAIFEGRYRFLWHTITNTPTNLLGSINYEDHQASLARMDRPKMFPLLAAKKSLIDTNGALLIASNCMWRLGYYNTNWFRVPPIVKQYAWSENPDNSSIPLTPLPYFSVVWSPIRPFGFIEGIEEYAFKLEVSGLDSRIVSFNRLISASIERCRIASVEEQLKMFESCRYYFTNSTSILQQERK
jgi:hypothetical protein